MSMKATSVQRILVGLAAAAILGANVSATSLAPRDLPRLAVGPAFPIVFHTKDVKSGLDIRTTQTKADEAIVEVSDGTVAIRKRIGGGSSETVLTAKSGVVTMGLRGGVITIVTKAGRLVGDLTNRESIVPVNLALARSQVAVLANRLLTRMVLNPDSVSGHALLLTRALLQSVQGDRTGTDALAAWSKNPRGGTSVRRIKNEDPGPEYCWDTYAVSAMHIWDDYASCYDSCSWYDYFCKGDCAFIYDLRAEGAFAWWMKCTALRMSI